ncbi:indolepyruvate oxidoreductase subunit beta [Caldanaerobius polysaccharolyticus]|uniref:indolepyruvate oxidoreductase subunit beta n=1 Tax=Caldanaerobius polysaccharolyticus TaxID=44256 RepID=UPI00047A5A51|nr:indolepyruvate oxidoreductase subunit beta [Caldanaerobius polysaccharolyticus]
MSKVESILIVGVGGQGTLLASRIIGKMAQIMGYDVKVSEVHGMSQRGGSVVTYVRYGDKVLSPLIERGQADIILGFEQLEAMRWIEYLKPEGMAIVNTQKILPAPVVLGFARYPDNIFHSFKERGINCIQVDALSLAQKCGSAKAVNTVLIGVLAKRSQVPKSVWLEALKNCVPPKTVDLNVKAFNMGYEE